MNSTDVAALCLALVLLGALLAYRSAKASEEAQEREVDVAFTAGLAFRADHLGVEDQASRIRQFRAWRQLALAYPERYRVKRSATHRADFRASLEEFDGKCWKAVGEQPHVWTPTCINQFTQLAQISKII